MIYLFVKKMVALYWVYTNLFWNTGLSKKKTVRQSEKIV